MPEEAVIASERINSILRCCSVVSPDRLSFDSEGKLVWYLAVDVYVLDADGSIFDAALAAVIAALRDVKLCRGVVDESNGNPVAEPGTETPLILERHPVASTFAVFDGAFLVDPTAEEESLEAASITIVCDETGAVCDVLKPGGAPVMPQSIIECVAAATARAKSILALLGKK